jgi:hypothetical protein
MFAVRIVSPRNNLGMSNDRESDLLAYILAGVVVAISAFAVTIASPNSTPSNTESAPNQLVAEKPAAVTAAGSVAGRNSTLRPARPPGLL